MDCVFARNSQPRILSLEQLKKIHQTILDVIERTGMHIEEPQSLELLHGAGADISDTKRVKIPAHVVNNALKQAPEQVIIYNRKGQPALKLGANHSYFGAHGDCPEVLDPLTSTRRRFFAEDAAITAKVCDALPNIEFISLNGFADDCADPVYAAPLIFVKMVQNTTKPLGFGCGEEIFDEVIRIATIVAGSEQQLRDKPFFYHYSEPTSPLVHSTPSLKRLIKSVQNGIPIVYTPMLMMGVTAPCSLAGPLIIGAAESLTGLVIAQLLKPGAPFIFGGIPGTMDMKSTIYPYGAPEMLLMVMALTDMAHYYKLPMFGTAGCTDAKTVDQQAATEAALSCYCAILSGANLVHDVGLIDHADMVSAELMVLCDELIDMIKHATQAIELTDLGLVRDLIDKVGPGGHYLLEDHTLSNFKKNWSSTLMDRTRLDPLKDQMLAPFSKRLNAKTKDIIANHQPEPLPPDIDKQLSDMIKKWLK